MPTDTLNFRLTKRPTDPARTDVRYYSCHKAKRETKKFGVNLKIESAYKVFQMFSQTARITLTLVLHAPVFCLLLTDVKSSSRNHSAQKKNCDC